MTPPLSNPTRTLRERPDLDQLKRQAKELLDAFVAGRADAVAEVHTHERRADATTFALHDAQRVLARSYGFDSWPKLKAYVEGVTATRFCDAVERDDLASVREMLRRRPELVNVERPTHGEQRAIHIAVMRRNAAMVRLLMTHGADARTGIHPYRDITTALTLAQERGWSDIVAIIEEAGSKPEADVTPTAMSEAKPTVSAAETAARDAVIRGDAAWLRARHAEGGLVYPLRWTTGGLLTLAVDHDRLDILTLLLDLGFDPNERVRIEDVEEVIYSQAMPLWHAVARGHQAMAELLLARGANPNLHTMAAGSPVYGAYSHQQWAMVDLLTRHGGLVTPDIVGHYRETDAARALIAQEDAGTLPDGMVPPGKTLAEELLWSAASGGDPEIVRLAVARLDWASDDSRWYYPMSKTLWFWNHIPWLRAGRKEFDRGTYVQCLRVILERASANLRGAHGRTMLHDVAGSDPWLTPDDRAPFAAALLDAGARLDVRDDLHRSTPLGWACRFGYAEIVELLIARGADPIEADAEPWATPRAWAEKSGHAAVLALLTP